MTNDRELLELAAKAAGYDTSHPWNSERLTLTPPVIALCIAGESTAWDPLTDDGHALRLAVKLNMDLGLNHPEACIKADIEDNWITEPWGSDPYAATRRAIVRAAAEIGKCML